MKLTACHVLIQACLRISNMIQFYSKDSQKEAVSCVGNLSGSLNDAIGILHQVDNKAV
jgi:hypothetical protein